MLMLILLITIFVVGSICIFVRLTLPQQKKPLKKTIYKLRLIDIVAKTFVPTISTTILSIFLLWSMIQRLIEGNYDNIAIII